MISGPYLEACMVANPEAAFGGTSRLLGLIETIYAAVQRPALWPQVMEDIAEAVHGESTTLFARFPAESLMAMTRTDAAAWESYATYYASVNTLMDRCDRRFADGEVRYSHLALPDHELVRTEFTTTFSSPTRCTTAWG
jgi:hypothetical protein